MTFRGRRALKLSAPSVALKMLQDAMNEVREATDKDANGHGRDRWERLR